MMSEPALQICIVIALAAFTLAIVVTIFRVIIGPTLADRILALDMLTSVSIGFVAVVSMKTGMSLYLDIAIGLCLVGFLATIAWSKYILKPKP